MAAKKDLPMLPATPVKPRPNCSWDGCLQKAVVFEEIEYGKGRHYLCEFHWVKAHALAATRRCEEKGLRTIEQKKEYCRRIVGMLFKPMPQAQREPGQDDEERAAA